MSVGNKSKTKARWRTMRVHCHPMFTTDQAAARLLIEALYAMDGSIALGLALGPVAASENETERCRISVMEAMADLILEFGLVDLASRVRGAKTEFDAGDEDDGE